MTTNLEERDAMTDGLMGDFLDESTDLLRRLNEGLFQLDQAVKAGTAASIGDGELMNDIFRAAHSLKGLSGMMGLQDINALTHKMENVFDAVRIGRLEVSGEVVDVSFQGMDRLDAMLEQLRGSGADGVEYQEVLERIEQVLRTDARRDAARNASAAETHGAVVSAAGAFDDPLAKILDDADIPPKYLGIFIDECDLTLDAVSDILLQDLDGSATESLLVCYHRIKGSAASIGLHRVGRLAHLVEDQLQDLRRRNALPAGGMIDSLLTSVDALRGYIAALRAGRTYDAELSLACGKILAFAATPLAADAPEGSYARGFAAPGMTENGRVDAPISVPEDRSRPANERRKLSDVVALAPADATGFAGCVDFQPGLALAELKAQLVLEKLGRHGKVFYSAPTEAELEAGAECRSLVFGATSDLSRRELLVELTISGVAHLELVPFDGSSVVAAATTSPPAHHATAQPAAAAPEPSLRGDSAEADVAGAAGANGRAAPNAETKAKPTETLRVDIERLDQLMNLAGQLVIAQARFSQIGRKLKRLFTDKSIAHSLSDAVKQVERLANDVREAPSDRPIDRETLHGRARQIHDELSGAQRDLGRFTEVRTVLNDLSEAVHQLDRVSDGIQSSVMDTRMVPIGPLFTRFKRVVRDLSRASGKDIRLEIHGEHTELDKRMIDELSDPLIHLIRNSADHGIETPDAREAAGKERQGAIRLNAFHRGNRIVIQVGDDGRGLDAAKIRAKAVAKGWMNEAEAEKLTDAQTYALIWRPGFSTAEQITEVSGRGMGMDIVWSKIEQLNGAVELTSAPGRGTTFEIKLPLTMAILPSLMMVVGDEAYAVPVESVVEIVRIGRDDVTTVYGRPTARVRGRVIGVVRLEDLFRNEPTRAPDPTESANLTVVILGAEGREIGLIVDDLLGEQDVVIKSLTENFRNVSGIAGASILGDGRVSLILDVSALLDMACRNDGPLGNSET